MSYWTVCQTESQREKVAFEFLKAGGFTAYLPRILVKKERVAPLFPGYVFVQIVEQWWAARWTVGVVRMLMWDDQPARVSDKVVCGIMKREGEDGLVKLPKNRGLMRGDAVRIVRGSFEGHLGLYEGMSGDARVCVLLELLGRSVPVSLERADVVAVNAEVTLG
jgi:transcription antitermination factor NusG